MDAISPGKKMRALASAFMSIVLAVGLLPLPALADTTAGGSPTLKAANVVTDPTEIKTEHPYADGESLEWTYVYDGEEDIAGLKVTFADSCATNDEDVLTVLDENGKVAAKLSGNFSNTQIVALDTRSLTFMFEADGDYHDTGFEVVSIVPLSDGDVAIAHMTDDEKKAFFSEDNLVINGVPASEYDSVTYELAADGEEQQKPVVSISSNGITLQEGVDFEIIYYLRGGRYVDDFSVPGVYEFVIAGVNAFEGYYVGRLDPETERYSEVLYDCVITAGIDVLIDLINSTEILSPDGIDVLESNADDKYALVCDFVSIAKAIEFDIDALEGDAEVLLGLEVYTKARSIIDTGKSYIDISGLSNRLTLTDQSGNKVPDKCKYLTSMPIEPNPILSIIDKETGEYVAVPASSVGVIYLDKHYDDYTDLPNQVGNYTVSFAGLGNYYGIAEFRNCIRLVDGFVFAYLDGDTLVITADEPSEGMAYYDDAADPVWDGERASNVAKWYGERDHIKHLRFDGEVVMPYNISHLLCGLDALESVDFTGMRTKSGTYNDYMLFSSLSDAFTQVTFSDGYIPNLRCGFVGSFLDPDYDESDPESRRTLEIDDFADTPSELLYGTWIRDNSDGLWKLAKKDVEVPTASENLVYNGDAQTAIEGNNLYDVEDGSAVEAGDYTATVTLWNTKRYQWADGTTDPVTVGWSIAKASVDEPEVASWLAYDGTEKTALAPSDLYDVEGGTATDAGDYTATVTIKDEKNYQWADGAQGAKTYRWTIGEATSVEAPAAPAGLVYDGAEKTAFSDTELYTVEGGTATDAGKHAAKLTLRDATRTRWAGGGSDPVTVEWSIAKASVAAPGATARFTYDGTAKTAVEASDLYTVEGGTATDAGDYTATVSLKDSANRQWADGGSDPVTVGWSIAALDISKAEVALKTASYTYDGKAKKPQVASVKLGDTAVGAANYDVSYASNVDAGKATVTVRGKANCTGSAKATFTIAPKQATPSVTLSKASLAYNGKAQAPSVTVKVGNKLLPAKAYSVALPKGRTNVGSYSVKVTLKGNYKGSKAAAYTIVPKATSVSKLSPGSKSLTVKWAKQAAQVDGYQVMLATNSKFTAGKKTVTVAGAKNASKAIKGLKGNAKYFAKVRTYKKVGKTTYYSAWSSAKSGKTKK